MQRLEIGLLGGDQVVFRLFAEVVDVLNEERIGEGMLGEEDDLGASRCEAADYCFAYS